MNQWLSSPPFQRLPLRLNDWPGGDSGPQNLPGVSIFKKDAEGIVYHPYPVYGSHLLELFQYNFMFYLTPA